MTAPARYAFGDFMLDMEGGELRRGDTRLALRPKCFDLLVYLIEQRGKLLSKEQLLDHLWADAVVSEATLSRTVASVRAALGDDPENPHYIETSSRRGYKFIAQVTDVGAAGAAVQPSAYSLVHKTREYPLGEGDHLIGRGRDVQIPIFTSAASRHHARVTVAGDHISLEDLGSRNGTFVNGKRVSGSVSIQVGDQIEIGGEQLIVWSPSAETPAAPERRA